MSSWVVSPVAGGEAASCPLDNSLTNIQWLGKMTSDGLGSCSIKQEVEEKENRHLEQSQAKVNERSCPPPGQSEPIQGISKKGSRSGRLRSRIAKFSC